LRRRTTTTTVAAVALLLAACGPADDEAETPDDLPDNEQPPGSEELDEDALGDDPATAPEDPLAGLPDLQEQVEDGTFRGEGIVLPIPEGWQFEPAAQLQGQVLATEGDEGLQQIFGQAVDVEDLPQPVTFEELLDSNREQFPDEEPAVDEEIDVEGAEQAHQLRYDALPATQEGLPEVSIVLIVADDGDGRLGSFNYAAATDDFEDAVAEQFVDVAGFDPDSDPTPPQMPELGEPEAEPEG
jgi:hypothetical protein